MAISTAGRSRRKFGVLLTGLLLAACGRGGRAVGPSTAPAFTLSDTGGQEVSLAQFRGRPVLVDFWATWCPPCRASIPYVQKLHEEFSAKGLTVLGVNVDAELSEVPPFIKRFGITYPVLFGEGKGVDEAYGVRGIPSFFLIDGNGRIVRRWSGFSDDFYRDARDAIQSLIQG